MEQRGEASHSHRATELLRAWGAGDAAAFEQLIPFVHAELRFFGGLSVEETADWRLAKVWLVRQLSGTRDDG